MSKNEKSKYKPAKKLFCDHKLILWYTHRKNNFQFVIVIFKYLFEKDLGIFYLYLLYAI